ncbi:DUF664 domain-containing protein [Ornithinimicrobium cerasi]|uniref:Methyltransferase domain-containing protein n=1 Tax=Ornithinimicrobium cerasi TaxID=2248773 RepID=A0A285VYN9_9MICO|nr:DUF664 domain-containing protein [Ornithinimicrobium cerasi]SOC58376.1 Methyltransferase domain-containing protein [Ornithinimicrobium cerasi]
MGTEHFDEHAETWDDPDKVARAQEVARAVVGSLGGRPVTSLLEYGAGTGLVTRALADLLPGIAATLADNSSGMREVMDGKVASGDLPAGSRVWDLDLEHQEPPPERFDLVVSSMVLHHVHDLDGVLRGLAALTEEGGVVAVADLDTEDGSFHAHTHDFDGHPGFDRTELAAAMGRAGLGEVGVEDCTQVEKEGTAYPVFLATARKGPPPVPALGDLKGWLLRYLQVARTALVWKLEGLSEYDARRPLTPTGTNLLGLVKHLAAVELGYLGDTFGRPSGIPLPWYDNGAEANADMWATEEESREEVVALYRRAWAHGDATVAALDLDSRGRVPHWAPDRADVTLGLILVHLATETARHAGHADILRELLDGRTGMREGVSNLPDLDDEGWSAHRERVEEAARQAAQR